MNKKKNDFQNCLSYALITPAHNEEGYIEGTIESVINQTLLPIIWVIVSDGSTDETDKIVSEYAKKHDWIEFIKLTKRDDRNFSGKANAFNLGWKEVLKKKPDIIGNIDADVTFEYDFFEFLLSKFKDDPSLGVAGAVFTEENGITYDYKYASSMHVSGLCQLFRSICLSEIGGYIPLKRGAIDWVAVTTARMKGWTTKSFMEKQVIHHRKIGTGNSGVLASCFRQGIKDYYVGGHPLWQLFRCLYHFKKKPYLFGGIVIWLGYCLALICQIKAPLPEGLRSFHRNEQKQRLKKLFHSYQKN